MCSQLMGTWWFHCRRRTISGVGSLSRRSHGQPHKQDSSDQTLRRVASEGKPLSQITSRKESSQQQQQQQPVMTSASSKLSATDAGSSKHLNSSAAATNGNIAMSSGHCISCPNLSQPATAPPDVSSISSSVQGWHVHQARPATAMAACENGISDNVICRGSKTDINMGTVRHDGTPVDDKQQPSTSNPDQLADAVQQMALQERASAGCNDSALVQVDTTVSDSIQQAAVSSTAGVPHASHGKLHLASIPENTSPGWQAGSRQHTSLPTHAPAANGLDTSSSRNTAGHHTPGISLFDATRKQHSPQHQQHQHQHTPFDRSNTDTLSSPPISREHSTTEAISREHSTASWLSSPSQENSATSLHGADSSWGQPSKPPSRQQSLISNADSHTRSSSSDGTGAPVSTASSGHVSPSSAFADSVFANTKHAGLPSAQHNEGVADSDQPETLRTEQAHAPSSPNQLGGVITYGSLGEGLAEAIDSCGAPEASPLPDMNSASGRVVTLNSINDASSSTGMQQLEPQLQQHAAREAELQERDHALQQGTKQATPGEQTDAKVQADAPVQQAAVTVGQHLPDVSQSLQHEQQPRPSLQSDAAQNKRPSGKSDSADNSRAGAHVLKPLFVPIVVYMDQPDHMLMAEEAMSNQQQAASSAGASCQDPGNGPMLSALRRMRIIQEYLCAYEAQGLPLVKVSYGNYAEALDKLHEYILQCIKTAMQV